MDLFPNSFHRFVLLGICALALAWPSLALGDVVDRGRTTDGKEEVETKTGATSELELELEATTILPFYSELNSRPGDAPSKIAEIENGTGGNRKWNKRKENLNVVLKSRLLLDSSTIHHVTNHLSNATTSANANKGPAMDDLDLDLVEDIESWDAPEFLKKQFPYYLSGYDDENRPIWIAEYGKYDIRKVVEEGEPNVSLLEKYAKQAFHRITKSIREQKRTEKENENEGDALDVSEAHYILDMDGITVAQLTHPPTLHFKLKLVRAYRDILVNHLAGVVIVNANYVAHSLINLFRPVFGRVMEKVEIYGTQPAKWIPQLRRIFPPESLPTWYGGSPEYRPLQVFG